MRVRRISSKWYLVLALGLALANVAGAQVTYEVRAISQPKSTTLEQARQENLPELYARAGGGIRDLFIHSEDLPWRATAFGSEGIVQAWMPLPLIDDLIAAKPLLALIHAAHSAGDTQQLQRHLGALSDRLQALTAARFAPVSGKGVGANVTLGIDDQGRALVGSYFYLVAADARSFRKGFAYSVSSKAGVLVLHLLAKDVDRADLSAIKVVSWAVAGYGMADASSENLPGQRVEPPGTGR